MADSADNTTAATTASEGSGSTAEQQAPPAGTATQEKGAPDSTALATSNSSSEKPPNSEAPASGGGGADDKENGDDSQPATAPKEKETKAKAEASKEEAVKDAVEPPVEKEKETEAKAEASKEEAVKDAVEAPAEKETATEKDSADGANARATAKEEPKVPQPEVKEDEKGGSDKKRVVGPATSSADDVPDEDEEDDGKFKKPAQVDLKTLVEKDKEDESLRKYKQSLLGDAAEGKVAASDDPRRVIIESFELVLDNHPNISIPMKTKEDLEAAQNKRYVFKEGETYRIRVRFHVQHDIVMGLRMTNRVYKMKMRVHKQKLMLGSYGPKAEAYEYLSPPDTWPKGFITRGNASARVTFTDDDGNTHLDMKYRFTLAKKWEKE